MKYFFLALLLLPSATWGATYYVRTGGSDGLDGLSWANAWQTNAKVQGSISAGDTVLYGKGYYWQTRIRPPTGATASDRTVYACSTFTTDPMLTAKDPIWSGGTMVVSWQFYSVPSPGDTIWRGAWTGTSCETGDGSNGIPYSGTQGGRYTSKQLVYTEAGLGTVNMPGEYSYNNTVDSVYLYPYDDSNPNSDTVVFACGSPGDFLANVDHTVYWGIDLRHSHTSPIAFGGGDQDSNLVAHCHIGFSGKDNQSNATAVFSDDIGTSNNRYGNQFIADSLGWVFENNVSGGGTPPQSGMAGGAFILYDMNRLIIESCYVYGYTDIGIMLKDSVINSTIKYCIFENLWGSEAVLYFYWGSNYDSAYGNIIDAGNCAWGIQIATRSPIQVWNQILNNSIYNPASIFVVTNPREADDSIQYVMKYNAFYKVGGTPWSFLGDDNEYTCLMFDSNIYYDDPVSTFSATVAGASRTWDVYRNTYKLDSLGDTTNPGFNDPGNGDFSRPAASNEMNATYGGKTWTIYGAIQPAAGGPVNDCPVVTLNTPTNGSTITSLPVNLVFDLSDPDGADTLIYVIKGEANDATPDDTLDVDTVVAPQSDITFPWTGLADLDTMYWMVIARDTADCYDTGGVWLFYTDTTTAPPGPETRPGLIIRPGS